MSSSTTFIHPARPILGRVFHVTLTKDQASALTWMLNYEKESIELSKWLVSFVQAELLQDGGPVAAPSELFVLKEESDGPDRRKARVDDATVVAPMEFTMRGVCTLWPHLLQCDTLNCYRLRGSLHKTLIYYYGNLLYSVLI
jgi:hypothetical protein